MDAMAKRYLEEFSKSLGALPASERQDAVREIESHLADARAAGQPTAAVLSGLGEPQALARAYLADYHLQQPQSMAATFQRFAFFATTSLTSLVVVPVLLVLAAGFGLITVLSPFALVMRLFGVPGYMVLSDQPMSILLAIPTAAALTLLGGLLTRGVLQLAQRYFRFIAAGYRTLRNLNGRQLAEQSR